jgi:hypothetical protein
VAKGAVHVTPPVSSVTGHPVPDNVLLLHSNRRNKYVVASELDLHDMNWQAAADAEWVPIQPFKVFAGHDLQWLAGTGDPFFLTARS